MKTIFKIAVDEGKTECEKCPFYMPAENNHDRDSCGIPRNFLDCDSVNYEKMEVLKDK